MYIFGASDIGKSADTRVLKPGGCEVAQEYAHGISQVHTSSYDLQTISVRHNKPHSSDTTVIDYTLRINGSLTPMTVSLAANAAHAGSGSSFVGSGYGTVNTDDLIEIVAIKSSALIDGRLDVIVTIE